MGKGETVAGGMSPQDMKRLFRLARGQPVSAALALAPEGGALLLLDKRRSEMVLDREMRADVPGGSLNRRGTVVVDEEDPGLALFTVNKEAPGLARKLLKTLKGTGIHRVRFLLPDGTVCDSAGEGDGDGDADGASSGADAVPGDGVPAATVSATPADPQPGGGAAADAGDGGPAAAIKARLVEQLGRVSAVLASDPSRREGLLALAGAARDHLRAGDLRNAVADVTGLTQAIDQPQADDDASTGGSLPRMMPPEPAEDDSGDGDGAAAGFVLVDYKPGQAQAKAPGAKPKPAPIVWLRFKAFVPKGTRTVEEMYRLFEVVAYGRVVNSPDWRCGGYCDMAKNQGKVVPFEVATASVAAQGDPAAAKRARGDKAALETMPEARRHALQTEAARRYVRTSGELPGPDAHTPGTGQAAVYDRSVSGVMQDRELLKKLPAEVAGLMGGKSGEYDPKNYTQLVRIAAKLQSFSASDLQLYKSLPLKATDNLDLFEQSLDVFLTRKAELLKAIEERDAQQGGPDDPTQAVWKDFDGSTLGAMSEGQREDLARRKANEIAAAELKQLADHPGEALKGVAKSATLINTPETMQAVGKDIAEAADGDANAYARWGAGAGAGAKLSGWVLAAAGVLYVASWATGVGELATIGAVAAYALGGMLTLSVAEEELRIKAASKETDPEKFKHDTEAAGQARATIAITLAVLVIAAVLHFTAKALFPEQVAKLKTTLKNFRDRVAKGPVASLKPALLQELAQHKAGFAKAGAAAKAHALDTARTVEGLSAQEFVKRLQSDGAGGFFDHGKLPAEQKVDFADLMKSEEGRHAIETYRQKLVETLRTDVVAEIDRLTARYVDALDAAAKDVDAAKSHDALAAATQKLEDLLGEEHAKQFMQGEQDDLVKRKLLEGSAEAQKEIEQAPATGAAKRVQDRIAASGQSDGFKLTYSTDEIMAILKKAKDLGLPDKMVEDLLLTASREAKRLSARELMTQMENWANVVSKRGYPFKFASLDEFKQFGTDLKDELAKGGVPADDVRVQGSSLRNPAANDIDLAVFVDQAAFDKMLIERYDGRIAFSKQAPAPNAGATIKLAGKSHAELVELAEEIARNSDNYNSTADTFSQAETKGKFNSKNDISRGLKGAQKAIAAKYPGLNIETVAIEVTGGAFDLKPDLPLPTK